MRKRGHGVKQGPDRGATTPDMAGIGMAEGVRLFMLAWAAGFVFFLVFLG